MLGPEHSWRQSGGVGAVVPGHTVGLRVASSGGLLCAGSAGLCPLSRVRVPSCSPASLLCSAHHSWPRFPAVCSHPVFPHHLHPGVLCISAVSEDPEAQFGVSLHQLPHRCGTGRQALSSGKPQLWGGFEGGTQRQGDGWFL